MNNIKYNRLCLILPFFFLLHLKFHDVFQPKIDFGVSSMIYLTYGWDHHLQFTHVYYTIILVVEFGDSKLQEGMKKGQRLFPLYLKFLFTLNTDSCLRDFHSVSFTEY